MATSLAKQIAYHWQRHVLRRRHLVAGGLPYGMRFRFRTPDDVGRRLYKRGVHEPHILALLEARKGAFRSTLVYDVGANLGWYSVLMERLLGQSAEIYAFEPDPGNRGLLEENLALNGARRVEAVDCALSDHEGRARLNRYRDVNLGRHSLGAVPEPVGSVEVRLQTLDGYAAGRGLAGRPVCLLKIDVEGHEPEVVRGAQATLAEVELLVLEYSPMFYPPGAAEEMLATLDRCGLAPSVFDGAAWRATDGAGLLALDHQVDTAWCRGSLVPG